MHPDNHPEQVEGREVGPLEEALCLQRETQVTLWFKRKAVTRKIMCNPEDATDKVLEMAEHGYQLSHGKRETRIFIY